MTTFCPLYKEGVEFEPWKNAQHPHIGLRFDKFANAWCKADGKWEFDKGQPPTREDSASWMMSFSGITCGDRNHLAEATRRQYELAEAHGSKVHCFTNTSRFITGIGRTHPADNGFAFHHTLGVPYLPGSGVKGVLASWLRETTNDWDEDKHRWKEDSNASRWFGSQDHVGAVIFLDLLPITPPNLVTEIMTPHYRPYYQDGNPPADWHSPVPIPFLAVEKDQNWQLAILPRQHSKPPKAELDTLLEDIAKALDWLGAGAKTAIGHGRFTRDKKAEGKQAERVNSERMQEQKNREHVSKLEDLSPLAQSLEESIREYNWDEESGAQHFMATGCEEWLDQIEAESEPPEDACRRLAQLVHRHFKSGLLAYPDRTKGKKNKPAFNKRQREIAHRLRALPGVKALIETRDKTGET